MIMDEENSHVKSFCYEEDQIISSGSSNLCRPQSPSLKTGQGGPKALNISCSSAINAHPPVQSNGRAVV
ncbi:hypothetical protein M514_01053 [Trichuris suis]|uniref:Uncharacterized protein n=1 Tax=Trichuris suis TaxID=68888 RepID=A0A085NM59_9BILA|nr:hypothetical protein M513_01053 [Trichuris suis]KFD70555.1 hypothetical protein M514_01053 [Trichuris suis]